MKVKERGVSRRTVLKIVTSSTMVPLLAGFSSGCGIGRADLDTTAAHLIQMLHYRQRAKTLGHAFIEQTPRLQDKSHRHFTREILAYLNVSPKNVSKETLHALPDKLRHQVTKDFEQENVVVVNGFMLSKTEALLCSLVATYTEN